MKRASLGCAAAFVAALMVASCGDDDSAPGDGGPDGGGADAAAGGSGQSGGGGSSTMTGGSGGRMMNTMPAPKPVVCGGMVCPVPLKNEYNLLAGFAQTAGIPLPAGGAGILPTACCTPREACGLIVMGEGCVPPPRRDPRCPNVTILGVTAPGCCVEATGMCGANGAQTGQGCIDVSGIAALLGGAPTAPRSCAVDAGQPDSGPPDAGHPTTVDDAGQEDAGK